MTACISRNGDIRVVDAEAGKTCPDTQTTVRLASTDATGKVADADLLDGIDSSGFLGATAKAADADNLDGRDSADFVRIIESTTRVVDYPPIAAHSCINATFKSASRPREPALSWERRSPGLRT